MKAEAHSEANVVIPALALLMAHTGGSRGGCEKWLDSGYILNAEPTGFLKRLWSVN